MKHSEATVAKWIGGGYNFTIATLARSEEAFWGKVIKV